MNLSNIRPLFVAIITTLAAAASSLAGPISKEGDIVWRYFKGTSTPAAQSGGTATWTTVTFDHSSWLGTAPCGFGYGDGDDATVLGDMQNSYTTVFLRDRFQIASTSGITHLTLAVDYDDGFVAYINNQEVARRNVAANPPVHTTVATANHNCSREGLNEYTSIVDVNEKEFITLNPSVLVNGTNVIAVSGHNISASSSDFSLIVELYTNVTLIRGPLLQLQNSSRITVTWRTDVAADSVVDYGFDLSYGSGTISNAGPTRWHAVELPALPAGSTVYYRVRTAGVNLSSNTFRSPPAANQPFRVAVIGDFGSANAGTRAVANQVAAANPDLNLAVGDNIYQTGQPGSFDEHWFQPYSNVIARAPVLTVLGNHDVRADTGQFTIANFALPTNGPPGLQERNFSFDYGSVHFVGIDSNPFDLGQAANMSAIKTWLSNDLAQATQAWKIVFYHHPPHTSVGSHDDLASFQADIAPLLEKYGVQFAFQGHNHWYERINPINGVNYITTGGGGFSLHGVSVRKDYSANLFNSLYSMVLMDVNGPALVLRALDQNGSLVDTYHYNLDHPFVMDGLTDSTNWVRASNGLRLNAAIRGYHLYLATQDSGEGSDHFIYVNNQPGGMTSANWGKSGQVMQWSAFLADENDGGFNGWFNAAQGMLTNPALCRAQTSGLNNNGANNNGVLEGTLQLLTHFGAFPTQLLVAAAPYGSADGGTNYAPAQVPAGDGDGDIEPNEFLSIATRDLALDLPVAEAGSNSTVEAGTWVGFDGSQSTAPSGLPLTFAWTQMNGPAGQLSSTTAASTSFRLTNQVAAATSIVLRLTVYDTRFDSNDTAQVTFTPMADLDADGLSDAEELAGVDNVLTMADPQGVTSDPADADSDDDGMSDGHEALAGTDRNSPASVLKLVDLVQAANSNLLIQWSSTSNKLYTLHASTNLRAAPQALESNIPAAWPVNVRTVIVDGVERFYLIEVQR